MRTSWFNRLLALATLLSWLGAAYHDVWLEASDIAHHHQHSDHQHDQSGEDKDSQHSVSLPDFHVIPHLAKSEFFTPQDYKVIHTVHLSDLLPVLTDLSFEFANAPPSSGNFFEFRNLFSLLLAHSVQPNAPPMFA
jgi:hypothetical protein